MVTLIPIRGEYIVAPIGGRTLVRGKVEWIRIISPGPEEFTLDYMIMCALLGLSVRTVFSEIDLRMPGMPKDTLFAFIEDLADTLIISGQSNAASLMLRTYLEPYHLFGFPRWSYEIDPLLIPH